MSDINILMATHNGADVLTRTLEGYADLEVQSIDYKLIIVNNASSDKTASIITEFSGQLPISSYDEPIPGKNNAMNTGLAHTDAEIIIMTDDDAIPHKGFLHHWIQAFNDMPDIALFGGSIVPEFERTPAPWMLTQKPRFEELYAHRENIMAGPISPDRIYGPNMAIRAEVIRAGLRFDTRIGPNASRAETYSMGSETAFLRAAVSEGFKTGFAPAPTVSHIVRSAQIEPAYIDGRAYRMGRGTAFKHVQDGTFTFKTRSRPLKLAGQIKRTVQNRVYHLQVKFGSEERRFHARWDAHFYRGYHDEIEQIKAERETASI